MRLRYETGVAALVQFIVMTFLNFLNTIFSSVGSCRTGVNDCVSGVILNLLFLIIITVWFGFLWVLGYTAQDRRSKRMAQILLLAEAVVAVIALFDARHHPNLLGLVTSLVDATLAIWVLVLAFRLMRAGGGRIVSRTARHASAPRTRRPTPPAKS